MFASFFHFFFEKGHFGLFSGALFDLRAGPHKKNQKLPCLCSPKENTAFTLIDLWKLEFFFKKGLFSFHTSVLESHSHTRVLQVEEEKAAQECATDKFKGTGLLMAAASAGARLV